MKVRVSMKDTGEKLKKLRINNNLTLEYVVENTGISESILKKIENGVSNISVINLVKLCGLYDTNIDEVLCYSIEI